MADERQINPVPNPAWASLVAWFSHSTTWTAIFGVLIALAMVIVPRWAGMTDLVATFDKLAPVLAGLFAVIAAGQKIADAASQGKTSAYVRHLEVKDQAAADDARKRAEEGVIAAEEKKLATEGQVPTPGSTP